MKANLTSRAVVAALAFLCGGALNDAFAQETSPTSKGQKSARDVWFEEHRAEQEKMMREMFPKAPATVRKAECFRGFPEGISIRAIVAKCGRPDGDPCSGVGCFFYELEDGSRIVAGYSSSPTHIRTLDHVLKSGKSVSLFVKK